MKWLILQNLTVFNHIYNKLYTIMHWTITKNIYIYVYIWIWFQYLKCVYYILFNYKNLWS